jgi:hypothetical protein
VEIKYSQHLNQRLRLREIDHELPGKIFKESQERYFDDTTGYLIAIMKTTLYNKNREVMVAYEEKDEVVTLLTIHPLKEGQKEKRICNNRWRKYDG